MAGRLTRSARRLTLHLPQRWPWENQFSRAVARFRALPLPAWTARIGLGEQLVTTKTLRRRFFSLAGRTRSARRLTLHLPQRWPWENRSVAPWLDCEQFHSQPDGTAGVNADGDLTVPANSRQPSPRRAFLAHRISNYARHGHCGPPSSCLGAYFMPPSSPSIGTWPGLFALPCPSTLVSTPAHTASVDSGLLILSLVRLSVNLLLSSDSVRVNEKRKCPVG